ncbi:hypothetical protein PR048_023019 [Dryococelus australis]|uniref:Uncharacterized protein n=1 Tax=Dryococelus australis TaxID=614101 RepID=A0ABQ9GSW3_9NEOP|nr:hypothetical protein PR048_023019 [Dryococelus australis]
MLDSWSYALKLVRYNFPYKLVRKLPRDLLPEYACKKLWRALWNNLSNDTCSHTRKDESIFNDSTSGGTYDLSGRRLFIPPGIIKLIPGAVAEIQRISLFVPRFPEAAAVNTRRNTTTPQLQFLLAGDEPLTGTQERADYRALGRSATSRRVHSAGDTKDSLIKDCVKAARQGPEIIATSANQGKKPATSKLLTTHRYRLTRRAQLHLSTTGQTPGKIAVMCESVRPASFHDRPDSREDPSHVRVRSTSSLQLDTASSIMFQVGTAQHRYKETRRAVLITENAIRRNVRDVGKWEIPEKTRRPESSSSDSITTREKLGATPPGIEFGHPRGFVAIPLATIPRVEQWIWPRLTSPHPAIQFVPKMFSIGLRSGLWAGQSNRRTLLSAYHCIVALDTWHLALSSWKHYTARMELKSLRKSRALTCLQLPYQGTYIYPLDVEVSLKFSRRRAGRVVKSYQGMWPSRLAGLGQGLRRQQVRWRPEPPLLRARYTPFLTSHSIPRNLFDTTTTRLASPGSFATLAEARPQQPEQTPTTSCVSHSTILLSLFFYPLALLKELGNLEVIDHGTPKASPDAPRTLKRRKISFTSSISRRLTRRLVSCLRLKAFVASQGRPFYQSSQRRNFTPFEGLASLLGGLVSRYALVPVPHSPRPHWQVSPVTLQSSPVLFVWRVGRLMALAVGSADPPDHSTPKTREFHFALPLALAEHAGSRRLVHCYLQRAVSPASMRVIEVSMEQRWDERASETGDPRENPPTNGIARQDSHMRKSGVTRPGIEAGSS